MSFTSSGHFLQLCSLPLFSSPMDGLVLPSFQSSFLSSLISFRLSSADSLLSCFLPPYISRYLPPVQLIRPLQAWKSSPIVFHFQLLFHLPMSIIPGKLARRVVYWLSGALRIGWGTELADIPCLKQAERIFYAILSTFQ